MTYTYNDLFNAEDDAAHASRAFTAAREAYQRSKSGIRMAAYLAAEDAFSAAITACDDIRQALEEATEAAADEAEAAERAAAAAASPTFNF